MPERAAIHGWRETLGYVLLAAALIVLPHLLSLSQQEILVLLVINVLLVSSYRLLTLTGEWSLAHVVIMGVGAYASALAAKEFGVPVPLSMLVGASIAAFLAFLLSFPLFRMKGFYFLIGSFAAGEVIRLVWKWSELTWLFGGPKGIKLIPPVPDIDALGIDFYDPVHLLLSLPDRRRACRSSSSTGSSSRASGSPSTPSTGRTSSPNRSASIRSAIACSPSSSPRSSPGSPARSTRIMSAR